MKSKRSYLILLALALAFQLSFVVTAAAQCGSAMSKRVHAQNRRDLDPVCEQRCNRNFRRCLGSGTNRRLCQLRHRNCLRICHV